MVITRVCTKRTDTRWSEVAVPRQLKTDPAPWHGPSAVRLPSLRSTSLCAWGSKVSRTCSPVVMLQIVHGAGDSPHGRVSLPTQPYAFYILYPCEWQIKTRQVYLTNASAFNIRLFFFTQFFLVCFKNLWMCSNIHKINVFLKNKRIENTRTHTYSHTHTAFCQQFNKVAPV